MEFLTGTTDLVKGAAILRERFPDIRLLCVTAGADGSYAHWKDLSVFQPAFKLGGTVETTGGGGYLLRVHDQFRARSRADGFD